MRILWLTPSLPCPTTGGRARQFNLIKQLSDEHQFTVLSFVYDFEVGYVDLLCSYCADVVTVPLHPSPPLGRWRNRVRSWWRLLFETRPNHIQTYPMQRLRCEMNRLLTCHAFDLIHIETLHPAQLVDRCLVRRALLVEQNIEASVQGGRLVQAKRPLDRFREWVEWRKLLRHEVVQLRRFPAVITVNEADAMQCRKLAPSTSVHVVPNGVDVGWFAPPANESSHRRQGLLFVGTMDYGPNVDAAAYFCKEIWPLVRQLVPEVTLTVAGACPVPEVLALGELPGVTVTGFVEDMRPYFWGAAACVVPLRNGGGTRLKILEAMAAGIPVVSTSIGAEGLDVTDGGSIVLADRPEHFADEVIRLLRDSGWNERLRANGRRLVEQFYDWRTIAPRLDAVYTDLFEKHE
jgi:glycosyltransferase involved in cell wall biosynthesis